ncbi:MAG: hypothetical protein ACOX18_00970 [Bacillota bacterium]|jgi:hypothetical protein
MEEKAFGLWRMFSEQPGLWPGWDHTQTPLAFHDSEQAVLFGHPHPPAEFVEKERDGITYHLARPKPPSFTANSAVIVNEVFTATVMWHEMDDEAGLGLVTHEAFHAWQMATGCPFGNMAVAMQYPVNNAEIQALAELEASLLLEAIRQDSRELALAAIDARAARQALLSTDVAAYEDAVELSEGLATYIEIKTAGPGSRLWNNKLEVLHRLNKNAWGADRLRFYYSGMAWGLLCDRYAPGWQRAGWRPAAELVAAALQHAPDPGRRDFPGHDFSALLERHQRETEQRREAIQAQLAQALPGSGVRVELVTRGNPVGAAWNPLTAVSFPGEGRFHPTALLYIYDSGARLEVKANCLEKEFLRRFLFERDDLDIRLDGQPLRHGLAQGCLEIVSSDASVYVPQARVRFAGRELIAEEVI